MKISKILAGMSAAALAASAMSLVSFAEDPVILYANLSSGTVSLIDELDEDGTTVKTQGVLTGSGIAVTDIYGIDFNVTIGADTAALVDAGEWVGGGMGYNSESTGWASKEWSFQDGVKDVTAVKAEDGSYDFVLKGDAAAFADTDTYAQLWLQNWTTSDFTFNAVTLLDKDGNALAVIESLPVLGGVPYSYGDIEGNGNLRIELFNIYGESNNDAALAAAYAALEFNDSLEVQFDIAGVPETADGFTAFLMFTDSAWAWGNWGAGTEGATDAVVNKDGTYSVKITKDMAAAKVVDEAGNATDEVATAKGVNVFCVDIPGLAAAANVADPGKDAKSDLKQKFAADAGISVSNVKLIVDGVEFDPTAEPAGDESQPASSEVVSEVTSETTSETASTESADSKTTDSKATTSSKAANNAASTNPSTGAAALAAVGVALAGAAVVATKKRK